MYKSVLSILLLLSTMSSLQAQSKKRSSAVNYRAYPYWIAMMDDPNANFFEVEKAFMQYFSAHELPEEEHDVIGEFNEREKFSSKRAIRKSNAANKLRLQVKKYNWWHEDNLPYVQSNGHILTPEERIKIHEQLNPKK